MATSALPLRGQNSIAGLPFVLCAIGWMLAAAAWTTLAPLQASVFTVFLFAGPHNWMETRYFLARMPVKWGAATTFFAVAIAGALLLAASQAALYTNPWLLPLWNVALCAWITALCVLRARERKQGSLELWPVALVASAWGLAAPDFFNLFLVYAHPLVALWFLDRQIRTSRPEWMSTWRKALWLVPLTITAMLLRLNATPGIPANDAIAFAITQHAGSDLLTGVSSHLLVSTHVFLETLHYGVWLIALPLLGLQNAPWKWKSIPLAQHREGWPRIVRLMLLAGIGACLLLWICFSLDYATTRRVYFTIAVIHVMAEVPFLIRMRA